MPSQRSAAGRVAGRPFPRGDVAVFDFLGVERWPFRPRRDPRGRGMDPRINSLDQVKLPGAPLDLPNPERGKEKYAETAQDEQPKPLRPAAVHGVLLICPVIMPGMLDKGVPGACLSMGMPG